MSTPIVVLLLGLSFMSVLDSLLLFSLVCGLFHFCSIFMTSSLALVLLLGLSCVSLCLLISMFLLGLFYVSTLMLDLRVVFPLFLWYLSLWFDLYDISSGLYVVAQIVLYLFSSFCVIFTAQFVLCVSSWFVLCIFSRFVLCVSSGFYVIFIVWSILCVISGLYVIFIIDRTLPNAFSLYTPRFYSLI